MGTRTYGQHCGLAVRARRAPPSCCDRRGDLPFRLRDSDGCGNERDDRHVDVATVVSGEERVASGRGAEHGNE